MTAHAFPHRHGRAVLAAVGLLLAAAYHADAADASPWAKDAHSAARLIGAGSLQDQGGMRLRAGVELTLQPGWKTYWRYPGDSGVPPRFNFARSENVKDVTVLWPAPHRFADGGGSSIGYVGRVVFPLRVAPADQDKPVLLRVDLDYGVCEKLCVPVDAKLELPLATRATAHDSELAASEARVPSRVAIGPREPLAILAVRRDGDRRPARVLVDIAAPNGSSVDLFAEGPTPDWALPLPQPAGQSAAGVRRFAFELDGLPAGAAPEGAVLKLTAVSAASAIEVSAPLD